MSQPPSASPSVGLALRDPLPWVWSGLVLVLGLVATMVAARLSWLDAVALDHSRFHEMVESTKQTFETHSEKYEQALLSLREWVQWTETPSLKDWENRVERLELAVNLKAVAEVGYMPFIIDWNLSRWKERIPAHWSNIWPVMPNRENCRVAYSTTTPEWRVCRLGTELPSGPWMEAYAKASQSGAMRTSGKMMITPRMTGFRALLATYNLVDLPTPISSEIPVQERFSLRVHDRENFLTGMVFADIAVDPLIESAFGKGELDVAFDLYSGPVAESNRLTRVNQPAVGHGPPYANGLSTNYVFAWYGQKWTLACYTTPMFWQKSRRDRASGILVGGGSLSLALAGLVWVQGRARSKAEAQALELKESRQLIREATEARSRLSRDLHDGTVQSIYIIGLGLEQARKELEGSSHAGQFVTKAIRDLDKVIAELRQHLQFHHGGIQPRSLGDAIEELAERWERSSGAQFEVQLPKDSLKSIPARVTLELLAITQECVSNSLRHGRAHKISIIVERPACRLQLTVSDDGCGFDPEQVAAGQGLANIRARAQAIGGLCDIQSKPGGPTRISIEVELG